MNRLIFTRLRNEIISILFENDTAIGINIYNPDNNLLGNVYVGVVDNIVKNIDAAFVRYDKVNSGYISMHDNKNPVFLNTKNTDKYCMGDLVLVQLQKEAMKLKKPMLTSCIEISGQYSVVIFGKKGTNVSSKIKEATRREQLLAILDRHSREDFAIIARTNAANAEDTYIENDVIRCINKLDEIIEHAKHCKSGTCVYENEQEYLSEIKNMRLESVDEIVTDDDILYRQIKSYVEDNDINIRGNIRLYADEYPLEKLYGLEKVLDDATRKKVWLKSGGFIVIEPTEALTAIDVNTGKAVNGKKSAQETFYNVNIEAAKEIARQIRLRNLSGIIIIDFIDMTDINMKKHLVDYLSELFDKDSVKCRVIDMTALNLIEVTRKKVKAPLHEILRKSKKTLDEMEKNM